MVKREETEEDSVWLFDPVQTGNGNPEPQTTNNEDDTNSELHLDTGSVKYSYITTLPPVVMLLNGSSNCNLKLIWSCAI